MGIDVVLSLLMGLALMGIGWLVKTLSKMGNQTRDLWVWHNKEDADGVKVWYVRQSLEDAIQRLADNIATQTKMLDKMITRMENLDRDVRSK